mmetsp:Transcript_18647/g.57925  ORF Transcript_18647/g.57925 Transcript_18647/m.57925 type:complete len:353 (-) Transcript_18647:2753-3811(-)
MADLSDALKAATGGASPGDTWVRPVLKKGVIFKEDSSGWVKFERRKFIVLIEGKALLFRSEISKYPSSIFPLGGTGRLLVSTEADDYRAVCSVETPLREYRFIVSPDTVLEWADAFRSCSAEQGARNPDDRPPTPSAYQRSPDKAAGGAPAEPAARTLRADTLNAGGVMAMLSARAQEGEYGEVHNPMLDQNGDNHERRGEGDGGDIYSGAIEITSPEASWAFGAEDGDTGLRQARASSTYSGRRRASSVAERSAEAARSEARRRELQRLRSEVLAGQNTDPGIMEIDPDEDALYGGLALRPPYSGGSATRSSVTTFTANPLSEEYNSEEDDATAAQRASSLAEARRAALGG